MAIVFTGSKTVTTDAHPNLTAATLTALLATAPENMTVAQVLQLQDAISRKPGGGAEGAVVGSLLT